MPILHYCNDEWIYIALCDNKFNFDPVEKLYKYNNTIKYPNKVYKEKYDPKSFMKRGDVINFNGSYRNENKMIFDGEKLHSLWTDVDDYGSVPPIFVCGDGPDEFNIGDFEDIIDHNSINWLSKEKLKEIEVYQKDNIVYGQVRIKGKLWIINFEISDDTEFNHVYRGWCSQKYNCILKDDNIFINIVKLNNFSNAKYQLTTFEEENYNKFISFIKENQNVNIINYNIKEKPDSQYYTMNAWYEFIVNKEYKLDINNKDFTFPLIWKKITQNYTSNALILDEDRYQFYINNNNNELDKIYINEITGYRINIKLVKNDEIVDNINKFITSLVDNYDNIDKRYPFNRDSSNSLEIYL
jgi:hypothetical protein